MGHALKVGDFFGALLVASWLSFADEPGPSAKDWVAQYVKLGGKAFLWPSDRSTIGIQKREGQQPFVGLKGLKPAAGIRRVVLQGFEAGDDDLEALVAWTELEQIDVIDGKRVTDKGVKALAAMPKLWELVLADTAVTSSGVGTFSGHKELARLTVSNTIVKNRVTSLDLKNLPKLKGLVLVCEGMTTVRLTMLPKLEWVADFSAELEEAELSELGSLTELDFRGTRLKKLTLSGLPNLESLDLRKTRLDADAVAKIQKLFPGAKVRR
jgi:hypothetical protein